MLTLSGDLPDARPGPLRLSGRGLHREHGRPSPTLQNPQLLPVTALPQPAPDVAGPITSCASPTDPRERLPPVNGYDRTSPRTYQRRTRRMQSGFGELLTQGTLSADLRVRRMCKGIDSLWPALWTYLDVPGVEPTNNVAERAIRPAVLWRKGSFGTQSGSGARFASAMLTVAATCRMHGLDLFAYLAEVCTASMADLAVPQLLPATA